MATCANCIHHSLCDYNTNISGNGKIRLVYAEGADVKCSFFQNTADVAPKSEVANILDELMKQAGEIAESYKKEADGMSCSELARIEYRGTQIGALLVQYKISELKKKYTEGKE